ncbi:hypothetical protein C2134_04435 [Chromobacterium sinusclupearum]|uniref:Uncharacterized protein n=1 Tax=Chromobacterium sinusclupearum TaxID=2077146 RepID=A0A2K4MST0_9NEIS|nr:hypothetical protein [Chromobacterium sinusclupearum]POA99825.1 hypothetical protein C2134_04435 [Chromobacterium sinusclupearum]
MDYKEINPLWRLADPLTVQQAAALIAGFDPNVVRFNSNNAAWFENDSGYTDNSGIGWVQTAFAALVNAINAHKLPAIIRRNARMAGWDEWPEVGEQARQLGSDELIPSLSYEPVVIYCETPDWGKSTVAVSDLVAWLEAAGIRTGFFFPNTTDSPDYLDPKNPRYAPKLAAAVKAWKAVTDESGKHPKQALTTWLNEHAAEFGLTDSNGLPIKMSIEDCAKVANWKPAGGAPTTPGD